jgi:methylthioribulose-1-phosphate dehydratase
VAERVTTPALLCELLRLFYVKDWVSGTGGGICGPAADGALYVAPTGVHKERVEPEDLFTISIADGTIIQQPRGELRPSECVPIFRAIARERGALSTVHSHALSAVLAGDLAAPDADHIVIAGLEMLKGLPGVGNADTHLVPVIGNTAREADLTGAVEAALKDPRFATARAIIVRDHGAYLFGVDPWEAKRHAEVYHFLFQAIYERARGGRA